MEDMFIVEEMKVIPSPEVLLIKEFRKLWETTDDKLLATSRMAVVYFMRSGVKNPFMGYNEDERMSKIMDALPGGSSIVEGCEKEIENAIKKFEELLKNGSPSWKFYYSALNAAHKMIGFFDTLDMSKKLRSGMPVYKPADITRALKDTRDVLKALTDLKKDVEQDNFSASRTRKNREINPFEK